MEPATESEEGNHRNHQNQSKKARVRAKEQGAASRTSELLWQKRGKEILSQKQSCSINNVAGKETKFFRIFVVNVFSTEDFL